MLPFQGSMKGIDPTYQVEMVIWGQKEGFLVLARELFRIKKNRMPALVWLLLSCVNLTIS